MAADRQYYPIRCSYAPDGQTDRISYVRGDIVSELVEVLKEARQPHFASGFDKHLNGKIDHLLGVMG